MANTKKTAAAPVAATPAPAAVEAKPAAKTPAAAKKVVEAVAEPAQVVEGGEAEASHFAELTAKLVSLVAVAKEVQAQLKVVQKEFDKLKKVVDKAEKKKAKARTTPSGFSKPVKISNEMADFAGVPRGSELSRTEVTKKVTQYIREKNLNDPKNRRIILPDAKLRALLKIPQNEQLSYFSIQRFLSSHFIKA